MDLFGGNAPGADDLAAVVRWEEEHSHDRIVVLSDVWLDRPDTFDKLHAVLSGKDARCLVCGHVKHFSSCGVMQPLLAQAQT